uniref:Uncharacterized protein n=1 Tax=Kalanchoe fedtschenkoi TaxID=63787 RepID=A0A7N0VF15_KALFE
MAAAEADNLSAVASPIDDDSKYGFQRPEMYQAALKGTVDGYDRHVFLCYKGPGAWPARVEDGADSLPKLFATAVKARKKDITVKTKVTVCGGGDGSGLEDGDVLVFPDMVIYRGLKESDVDGFVEDVIVRGETWSAGNKEEVTATYVFVCAHGSRDKRCGVCGPVLLDKLKEEIGTRGLSEQVITSPCSHIGGHKYAGNLIIYGPDPNGKVTGHWYGYVTPDDVPELLDSHIGKGEIIEKLWRGQMGVYEEGGKEDEKKLPNGKELKKEKKRKEEPTVVEKEAPSGCCQGANGVSCCRVESSEAKSKTDVNNKMFGKLSCWMGSLEQEDYLAAAAVIGALATVAVAYSFYRRSA